MIATPNSVKLLGANPVFVDVETGAMCIDVRKAEASITPKTKAIVHVSMNARCNNIEELVAVCRRRGVKLVEDSAQSLGSYHNGVHLGTFGDVGSFSFSSPKIISTGQGGALVTNDDALAAHIRQLKDFGRSTGGIDTHDVIGWNFKFTDMQGVVGVEQMKKLPFRVRRMRELWDLYREQLRGVPQVDMSAYADAEEGWIPWFIDIYTDDRDDLQKHLKAQGIGSRVVYPAIHTQPAYRECNAMTFPVTETFSTRGLWLPSSSKLTDTEVSRVCDAIKAFYARPRPKL
eukprot:g4795.t1